MHIKYQTANKELNEHPDITFSICKEALKNTDRPLKTAQKHKWRELKQKAKNAILEKRKTCPGYAPNIIIKNTSILNRQIEDQRPISPHTIAEQSVTQSEDRLENCLSLYKDYIGEEIPYEAFFLCQEQLTDLSREEDQELNQPNNTLNKTLQKELWQTLKEYSNLKARCFFKKQSNCFLQALQIQLKQKTKIDDVNTLIRNNFLVVPSNIRDKLVKIRNKEEKSLKSIEAELQKNFEESPQRIHDFLNPPAIDGINWDRFAKIQPDVSVLLSIIDPVQFPEIHKMALEGHEKIESQMKRQFIAFISTTLLFTLGSAIELYRQNFPPEIYISIPIFIFIIGFLLSLAYPLITSQFTDEAILLDIKNYCDQ